jgi:hypothetical protein
MTLPGVSNIASLLFASADRMYAALRARPERRPWGHLTRCGAAAALFLLALAPAARAEDPTPGRQQQLLRMVRQDCGACHGMQLTGGLGPAITASALADRGFDMVAVLGRVEGWATCRTPPPCSRAMRRYAYVFGRDGGLTKVDLLTQASSSASSRPATPSAAPSRRTAAWWPRRTTAGRRQGVRRETLGTARRHSGRRSSTASARAVVGLADLPGNRFIFSLFDAGEIWVADLSDPKTPKVTRHTGIGKPALRRAWSRPTAAGTSPACSARTAWRRARPVEPEQPGAPRALPATAGRAAAAGVQDAAPARLGGRRRPRLPARRSAARGAGGRHRHLAGGRPHPGRRPAGVRHGAPGRPPDLGQLRLPRLRPVQVIDTWSRRSCTPEARQGRAAHGVHAARRKRLDRRATTTAWWSTTPPASRNWRAAGADAPSGIFFTSRAARFGLLMPCHQPDSTTIGLPPAQRLAARLPAGARALRGDGLRPVRQQRGNRDRRLRRLRARGVQPHRRRVRRRAVLGAGAPWPPWPRRPNGWKPWRHRSSSHLPEVNHNYEREHRYNLWFVVTGARRGQVAAQVDGHRARHRPASRVMEAADAARSTASTSASTSGEGHIGQPAARAAACAGARRWPRADRTDWPPAPWRAGLPLVERPYDAGAESCGLAEDEVWPRCSAGLDRGHADRRFGVVVRHHELGFDAQRDDGVRRARTPRRRRRRALGPSPASPCATAARAARLAVQPVLHGAWPRPRRGACGDRAPRARQRPGRPLPRPGAVLRRRFKQQGRRYFATAWQARPRPRGSGVACPPEVRTARQRRPRLINRLHGGLPLVDRTFAAVGAELGLERSSRSSSACNAAGRRRADALRPAVPDRTRMGGPVRAGRDGGAGGTLRARRRIRQCCSPRSPTTTGASTRSTCGSSAPPKPRRRSRRPSPTSRR